MNTCPTCALDLYEDGGKKICPGCGKEYVEEEIMEPGIELDSLIAEKIMGLEVIRSSKRYLEVMENGGDFHGRKHVCTIACHNETYKKQRPGRSIAIVDAYSKSIAAAWRVVEEMNKLLTIHSEFQLRYVAFNSEWHIDYGEKTHVAADTAPHAICLAALKAVGHDEPFNRDADGNVILDLEGINPVVPKEEGEI